MTPSRALPARRLLPVALAIAGVAALACSGGAPEPPTPPAPTPTIAPAPLPRPAAEFRADGYGDFAGKEITLSDLLAEGRPLVLNLGTTLPAPARAELPALERVARDLSGRVNFFFADIGAIAHVGGDDPAILAELAPSIPSGQVSDAGIVVDYEILGLPSTVLIGPEGELLARWTGAITESKLRALITEHFGLSG